MLADDTIRSAFRTAWHLPLDGWTPLTGGLTSLNWLVSAGSARYVAKSADVRQIEQFAAGLTVAEHVARLGVDTGIPVQSAAGAKCVQVGDRVLALLQFVPGRPLERDDPIDQQWWGDRLGAVHRALSKSAFPGLPRWHWVRPDAEHLGLAPWLRPAIADAVLALTKLQVTDRLTFGVLHGDPYYGAFLLDPGTGRIGLIDWGSACTGPLMYDVASAVMYAGGPERAEGLLDAYLAAGPVTKAEMEAALPTLLRFRWAVQADFFAKRLAGERLREPPGVQSAGERLREPPGVQSGGGGCQEDIDGLDHARVALTTQVFEH